MAFEGIVKQLGPLLSSVLPSAHTVSLSPLPSIYLLLTPTDWTHSRETHLIHHQRYWVDVNMCERNTFISNILYGYIGLHIDYVKHVFPQST
jgi:hypothetical protein